MIQKLARCFTVSVGSTVLTAALIVTFAIGLGVPGAIANVLAVLIATGPSYLANRRWVWGIRGRSSYAREVAPFVGLSIAGLALSTVAVGAMDAVSTDWPASFRALALPLANVGAYGLLWIVQFVMLDRVIFRDRAAGVPPHAGARSRPADVLGGDALSVPVQSEPA